jgi:hypothetical protein
MKTLTFRLVTTLSVAALLVGCSGGGIAEGVPKDAPPLTGPVEGKSKEMEILTKAKPKPQSAVKGL